MEYLKNVILQFLKCRPNEREHLVPVLSTMLKLSQEEKDLVIQQARGDFNDESSLEQVVFRGQGYKCKGFPNARNADKSKCRILIYCCASINGIRHGLTLLLFGVNATCKITIQDTMFRPSCQVP